MLKFWRKRWSESSRLTRFGFWMAIVAAVLAATATGLWVGSDYTGPWEHVSDVITPFMLVGLLVQSVGHFRDRREDRPKADG